MPTDPSLPNAMPTTVTATMILTHALTLLKNENAWCQGRSRVVEEGEIVKRDLMEALFAGGIANGYAIGSPAWEEAMKLAFEETAGEGITLFNDNNSHTHRDVVALLERALKKVN